MSRSLRVLIIEDEALIAANLEMLLEDAGHLVVGWAMDAAEARRLAHAQNPDIAIVDIQLRRGDDGIVVAAELREKGVEVVFVTAQADPLTVARANAVDHRAYVGKPYTSGQILDALASD